MTSGPRSIGLLTIKSIKDYAEGTGFQKFRKQREGKEHLAITVIGSRSLELDASNTEDKQLFMDCLNLALLNPRLKSLT